MTKLIAIRLDESAIQKLKKDSRLAGLSQSRYISKLITEGKTAIQIKESAIPTKIKELQNKIKEIEFKEIGKGSFRERLR